MIIANIISSVEGHVVIFNVNVGRCNGCSSRLNMYLNWKVAANDRIAVDAVPEDIQGMDNGQWSVLT